MKKHYKNWIQFVLGLSKKNAAKSEPTHIHYHVHVHMDEPKLYQKVLNQVTGELPLAVATVPVKPPIQIDVPYQQVY